MSQAEFTSSLNTQSLNTNHNHLRAPSINGCLPDNRIDPSQLFDTEAYGATQKEKGEPSALIVDDAPDVTEMLAMMLRISGYGVVAVFSAAAALAAAREQRFDVVISDIGMPSMNGYELAEKLRALPGYESIPMIALTGFSMYEDRERALASGFDAFLTKPIDPAKLIELIERLQH
jgi:CheY-like chemotaxis protein